MNDPGIVYKNACLVLTCLAFALTGCGGGGDGGEGGGQTPQVPASPVTVVPDPGQPPVTAVIGSTGGSVSLPGVTTVTFSGNAFPANRNVQVTTSRQDSFVSIFSLASAIFGANTRTYEIRIDTGESPPASSMQVAITVPGQLLGVPASQVKVFALVTQADSLSSFELIDSTFDQASRSLSVSLPGNGAVFTTDFNNRRSFEAVLTVVIVAPSSQVTRWFDQLPSFIRNAYAQVVGLPCILNPVARDYEVHPAGVFDPSGDILKRPCNNGTPDCHRPHFGIDILANDAVFAVAEGVVELNEVQINKETGKGYGHHILVRHKDGGFSHYAHLAGDENSGPRKGQPVTVMQAIGLAGDTGAPGNIHLHFEYRTATANRGTQVNPEPFLRGWYDGEYRGSSTTTDFMGNTFNHTESATITRFKVKGRHAFALGFVEVGSFTYEGNVVAQPGGLIGEAPIVGTGTINNAGIRPFVITSGRAFTRPDGTGGMFWGGIDPVFGPIGGGANKVVQPTIGCPPR